MTLHVVCDVNSFVLNFATVVFSPTTDLTAKDVSDPSALIFQMTNLLNLVTGCPITDIKLYTVGSLAGSDISAATYLGDSGGGVHDF